MNFISFWHFIICRKTLEVYKHFSIDFVLFCFAKINLTIKECDHRTHGLKALINFSFCNLNANGRAQANPTTTIYTNMVCLFVLYARVIYLLFEINCGNKSFSLTLHGYSLLSVTSLISLFISESSSAPLFCSTYPFFCVHKFEANTVLCCLLK